MLALVAGTSGLADPPREGRPADWSLVNAKDSLDHAQSAMIRGELDRAEALLRDAWMHVQTRDRAAALLRELHDRSDHRLEADEQSLSVALDQVGRGFHLHRGKRFVIVSDCDSATVRARAGVLEHAFHQYFRAADKLALPVYPPSRKLVCVLFKRHTDYLEFARAHEPGVADWAGGFYSPTTNRVVFFCDQSSPALESALRTLDSYEGLARTRREHAATARKRGDSAGAEVLEASADNLERSVKDERQRLENLTASHGVAKTLHEAVHLLSFNTGLQDRRRVDPFWVSEGLATVFEADDAFTPVGPEHRCEARDIQANALRARFVPTAELAGVLHPPTDSSIAEVLYAQSYSLFRHLYTTRRAALSAYLREIMDTGPQENHPDAEVARFERHFGKPSLLDQRAYPATSTHAGAYSDR